MQRISGRQYSFISEKLSSPNTAGIAGKKNSIIGEPSGEW
jgi:hypothetical protein